MRSDGARVEATAETTVSHGSTAVKQPTAITVCHLINDGAIAGEIEAGVDGNIQ